MKWAPLDRFVLLDNWAMLALLLLFGSSYSDIRREKVEEVDFEGRYTFIRPTYLFLNPSSSNTLPHLISPILLIEYTRFVWFMLVLSYFCLYTHLPSPVPFRSILLTPTLLSCQNRTESNESHLIPSLHPHPPPPKTEPFPHQLPISWAVVLYTTQHQTTLRCWRSPKLK